MGDDREITDEESILLAFQRNRDGLVAYAYTILRDWHAAEDVVQEAYLIATRKRESLREIGAVFAWLRGIVRLKCFEVLRRQKREVATEFSEMESMIAQMMDEHWDQAASDALNRRVRALRHCLSILSEKNRHLLEAFYLERKSAGDLAGTVGRKQESLWQQLYRLRAKVRECVEGRLAKQL